MIELENVSFKYQDKYILDKVSKNFDQGLVHGIVGLNGAGKTTLFNLLAGFLTPYEGTIMTNGTPLNKQKIAFLETDLYFYPNLSAREFLSVFPKTNEHFNEIAFSEIFNIPLDELVINYSTGMKKKLMLLSQIKQNKQVFILDEPFNGLDIEASATLKCIISVLKEKGKTIFISSHIFSSLIDVSDVIHHVSDGKIEKSFQETEFPSMETEIFGQQNLELKNSLRHLL